MHVIHEVAIPLRFKCPDDFFGDFYASNSDSFREYQRLLRHYSRTAWESHDCSYCKDGILPGEWYDGWVYVEVEDGKKRFYVLKKHYPECPRDQRDMEERMRREWEREDRERERETLREAA